jgi:uncharacterized protein (DUF2147 family)
MKIKKLVALFTLLLSGWLISNALNQNNEADKILGVWLTANKDGKIEIFKVGESYFGKLVWGNDLYEADGKTLKKDTKNEDVSKRSRPLKGLLLLNGFTYKDGSYVDGNIYDPNNGKTYSCKMKLNGDKLDIRGYIGISLLGRTEVWERVK